jgi:hypothetical protein
MVRSLRIERSLPVLQTGAITRLAHFAFNNIPPRCRSLREWFWRPFCPAGARYIWNCSDTIRVGLRQRFYRVLRYPYRQQFRLVREPRFELGIGRSRLPRLPLPHSLQITLAIACITDARILKRWICYQIRCIW